MSDGTLARLERDHPQIDWREPIAITLPGARGYACRICIANDGLAASEVERVEADAEVVRRHIVEAHG